jgi:hypothetical protein
MKHDAKKQLDRFVDARRVSASQSSAVDQGTDKVQERLVFWTVGSIPEEFTDGRVGYLSTRAKVRPMLHDRHIGSRVADQKPGIAVAAFVQNSLSHVELIGLAVLGSSARPAAECS